MGLIGLAAGLVIYYWRGDRPSGQPPTDPTANLAATAPSQLIGLGYLPGDAAVVFAIQPGPVLAYAARTRQDPRDLLTRAGLPAQVLDVLSRIGLPLEGIDHVAGAVNVDAVRLSLVLVSRGPIEEERVLKQLRAIRTNNSRVRYSIDAGGLPLTLVPVSPTVWAFGFDAEEDLKAVERGGYGPGGTQFAAGLTEMIGRAPPDAAAWIATDEVRWAEKPLVKMAIAEFLRKPEWLATLSKGRGLAAALSFREDSTRLALFIKASDGSTGERLRTYFRARAAREESGTSGGAGELAYLEIPLDPATALATLREMLNEAVKP
jgi:hypothetical protein